MSATVAGNQQQQYPHQEWDINDSNVPKVCNDIYSIDIAYYKYIYVSIA